MKYTSVFGDLTRNIQARFDAVSKLNKQLFDNVVIEKYLDWDVPTIGLNFEEIIGKYNVSVAAATIGDSSNEPIMGTEGVATMQEKVLTHAMTLPMTIQEYRTVLQILDSKSISDQAAKQQLIKLMWGSVEDVVASIYGKLDMIFLGALSNEGKFEFNETNNPEGGVRGVIDYKQPLSNIASAKTAWTDENLSTVDCFEDILAIIDAASDHVQFGKILLAPSLLTYICRASKTKQLVHGTDLGTRIVQLADLNAYMASNNLPQFEVIRRSIRVQNGTARTPYTPWNAKNMVFVPDGKLGVIKNAYANSELRQDPGVSYSNYGRIRVSKWGVGEAQGSKGVEFTKAESVSIPLITEMNGIYTFKTQE